MDILRLIGRKKPLFESDILSRQMELTKLVSRSRFLVIGGAGSIGQAVTREIFKRNPLVLSISSRVPENLVIKCV